MTQSFVGRCNNLNHDDHLRLLSEVLHIDMPDFNLLLELVRDTSSEYIFRVGALERITQIVDNYNHVKREILLSLLDEILTYEDNGTPVEKDYHLRLTAFSAICHLLRKDDLAKWQDRVSKDPRLRTLYLISLND